MDNYDDIINFPHHVSKRHPQMSMWNRAAQFAPFAALTGYEDAINLTMLSRAESGAYGQGRPDTSHIKAGMPITKISSPSR